MNTLAELLARGPLERASEILTADAVAEDPCFAKARAAHAVWRDLAVAGLPDRRALDPLGFGAALLPSLVLIDVLAGGGDYRWRLFGSRHLEEYGADLTGTRLSELEQATPDTGSFRAILDAVVAAAAPRYFRLVYLSRGEVVRCACGVMLPLRDAGPGVAVLLGAADWQQPPCGA